MRVRRFIATVKPYRPVHIYGRAKSAGKNYIRRTFPRQVRGLLMRRHPQGLVPAPFTVKPAWLCKIDRAAEYADAEGIIKGTFRFFGIDQDYGDSIRWRNPIGNYLFDFQLHSFGFLNSLRCLAEDGDQPERAVHCGKDIMRHWIEHCPYPHRPGWHSEVISTRLPTWIKFLIDFPEESDADLWDSISQQATCLSCNIETFLPGQQLIRNGVALAFAGLYFLALEDAKPWLDRGMRIVRQQLDRQILPGGGHVERSPMYHCILLEGLIDCYNLLKARQMDALWLADTLKAMAQRMADYLHPDHDIPLLNDSALKFASHPLDILHYAKASFNFKLEPFSRAHEDDGYFVFKDDTGFLVIDCGPLGPDCLPSHAHADTLSYEMSVGKQRVIVDSGVFSYLNDDLRTQCRGTAAHNTVVVDSRDQSEMWRSFRVGTRARPIGPAVFDHGQLAGFTGAHDGYRILPGTVIHQRTLLHVPDKFFVITDVLTGTGVHRLESCLHFAPGLKVDWRDDRYVVADNGKTLLQVVPFRCELPEKAPTWCFPELGQKRQNVRVVFELTAELPCRFGYLLVPSAAPASMECGLGDGESFYRVELDGKTTTIRGVGNHYVLE